MDVGWSQLQSELIEIIARKLTTYADYIRFRAFCVKWRSTLPPIPHHIPSQFPWLMLPYNSNSLNRRGFFSLSENKVYWLNLPEICHGSRCCGSSQGWLVLLGQSPIILLFNPLTSIQIHLPPITTFPKVLDFNISKVGKEYLLMDSPYRRSLNYMLDLFIKKIVLSSSPASLSSDYVAVAILNETGELAFCKKGVRAWTMIEDAQSYSEDVIYYKGSFYAVNLIGSLAICDISGLSPLVTKIAVPAPQPVIGADILYLVDSFGELLLVSRHLEFVMDTEPNISVYKTLRFNVFRLDSSLPYWVEVESLGDCMLFLGGNSSLCLLASDFSGCEGNCIYFTDYDSKANDYGKRRIHDSGVFNVGDRSIKQLPYCSGFSRLFLPPPIWVITNAC
ncbi:Protein of unknown function DUF295 [Macleaya cordata]|uniref:KIB1-4 beta-propeller domain-containing protein n=1 Tax=Macleaya cordata TaxID=56857 RepID=A0A200QKE6_MACCD|nr:Protein of unknown function DUF295 [Macleaya cordata]